MYCICISVSFSEVLYPSLAHHRWVAPSLAPILHDKNCRKGFLPTHCLNYLNALSKTSDANAESRVLITH